MADLRVQRGYRLLGTKLVHETEPHRHAHDRADDHRVSGIAREPRHRRGGEKQQEQRIAELAGEHRPRAHRVAAEHVGAVDGEPVLRLGRGETGRPRLQRLERVANRKARDTVEVLEH